MSSVLLRPEIDGSFQRTVIAVGIKFIVSMLPENVIGLPYMMNPPGDFVPEMKPFSGQKTFNAKPFQFEESNLYPRFRNIRTIWRIHWRVHASPAGAVRVVLLSSFFRFKFEANAELPAVSLSAGWILTEESSHVRSVLRKFSNSIRAHCGPSDGASSRSKYLIGSGRTQCKKNNVNSCKVIPARLARFVIIDSN